MIFENSMIWYTSMPAYMAYGTYNRPSPHLPITSITYLTLTLNSHYPWPSPAAAAAAAAFQSNPIQSSSIPCLTLTLNSHPILLLLLLLLLLLMMMSHHHQARPLGHHQATRPGHHQARPGQQTGVPVRQMMSHHPPTIHYSNTLCITEGYNITINYILLFAVKLVSLCI